MTCFNCSSNRITTEYVDHYIPYRLGNLIGITIKVPVRTCIKCNNQWLDDEAEDIISKIIEKIK